jgi:hypothetical protein
MNTKTCSSALNRPRRTYPRSTAEASAFGRRTWTLASGFLAAVLLAGCASTKVTDRERLVSEKLPRPNQILVYDFASSPAEVPADSMFAGQQPLVAATPEQVALGRQLGFTIAQRLVEKIRDMELPAVQATASSKAQVNDIVIRGYLVSVDQGSAAARMTIGFGAGNSELMTAVEGYQMTAQGLRKLGSAMVGAKGAKGPGAGVGALGWAVTGSPIGLIASGGMKIYGEASGTATVEGRAKSTANEIADKLKIRFQEEGWIK